MSHTNPSRQFDLFHTNVVGQSIDIISTPVAAALPLQVQILEDRTVPAFILNLTGDLLTITADNTVAEKLFVEAPTLTQLRIVDQNGNKLFTDGTVTLDASAGEADVRIAAAGINPVKIVGATDFVNVLQLGKLEANELDTVTLIGGDGDDQLGVAELANVFLFNLELIGNAGDDTLVSGNSPTTFSGGTGNNTLTVGTGLTQFTFDLADTSRNLINRNSNFANGNIKLVGDLDATLDLSLTTEQTVSTNLKLTITDVTILDLVSGAGNDTLVGNDSFNRIDGGAGNDTIGGGSDNDSITGGVGDDSLEGEAGDDTLLGNAGRDTVHGGAGTNNIGSEDLIEAGNYLIG